MSYTFTAGATSQSIELYIIDSTDGTPETGVLWNTAGIDLKYRRKDAAVVSITEAALTTPALTDTWETGGFLEIGNGVYRLDLPDAALAAGVDRVVVFGTVTGMVVLPVTIHLLALDLSTALSSQTIGTCTTNTDLVSAAAVVNEWETQSQADPTGFHVNVMEVNGTGQTANDNGADINAILSDTGELQTDWANGGRLDLILDIIAADTTTDIPALIATAQADLDIITGATGVNLLAATQASIDAIEADTGELQTDWANGGRLDLIIDIIAADTTTDIPALIATAQADLDTITGATGVNLLAATQASIDAIEADTNELQTDWANGGRLDLILDAASAPSAATVADAVWDEASADHVAAGSTGKALSDLVPGSAVNLVIAGAEISIT